MIWPGFRHIHHDLAEDRITFGRNPNLPVKPVQDSANVFRLVSIDDLLPEKMERFDRVLKRLVRLNGRQLQDEGAQELAHDQILVRSSGFMSNSETGALLSVNFLAAGMDIVSVLPLLKMSIPTSRAPLMRSRACWPRRKPRKRWSSSSSDQRFVPDRSQQ